VKSRDFGHFISLDGIIP